MIHSTSSNSSPNDWRFLNHFGYDFGRKFAKKRRFLAQLIHFEAILRTRKLSFGKTNFFIIKLSLFRAYFLANQFSKNVFWPQKNYVLSKKWVFERVKIIPCRWFGAQIKAYSTGFPMRYNTWGKKKLSRAQNWVEKKHGFSK